MKTTNNFKLLLAPMSQVTTIPFRLLCKQYGASIVFSEMINVEAYLQKSTKTLKRTYFVDEERPIGIQLAGSSINNLAKGAKKIEKELKPDLIDLNVGCPAYNVMKSGCGSILLNNPTYLAKLIKNVSDSISLPLTCKIRITENPSKTIEIAKMIEKAGAKALTVHGRTAKQKYAGKANWEIIAKIKHSISIPVYLNGDVRDEMSAKSALETGVDGIMIGRGAIGNPRIFSRISHYLKQNKKLAPDSYANKHKDFLTFIEFATKYEFTDIKNIKMQAQNMLRGYPGAKNLKNTITKQNTIEEILECLKKENTKIY